MYKAVLEKNLLLSALKNSNNWGLFYSCRTIRQVNQSVDGGSPDQDPVMAGPISRPEPIENLWNVIKSMKDVIVNQGYSSKYWFINFSLPYLRSENT